MVRRFVRAAIVAALISGGPLVTEARADIISLIAGATYQFDVFWSMPVSKNGTSTTLQALAEFDVTVSDTFTDFLITLTNNTALVSESVHSIGLDTLPEATALSDPVPGSVFQNFALNQKFPSFHTIDICAWTSNNCSGGAQGNNLPGGGAADTFGFRLQSDFTNGLDITNFPIKFQGELGSYEFSGTPTPPITVLDYDSSASLPPSAWLSSSRSGQAFGADAPQSHISFHNRADPVAENYSPQVTVFANHARRPARSLSLSLFCHSLSLSECAPCTGTKTGTAGRHLRDSRAQMTPFLSR